MLSEIRPAIVVFLFFSVLTGLIYPLAITGVSQVVFPHQANGSLIEHDGKLIGSELIAQGFDQPQYFWSRPSAAQLQRRRIDRFELGTDESSAAGRREGAFGDAQSGRPREPTSRASRSGHCIRQRS